MSETIANKLREMMKPHPEYTLIGALIGKDDCGTFIAGGVDMDWMSLFEGMEKIHAMLLDEAPPAVTEAYFVRLNARRLEATILENVSSEDMAHG